MNLGRKTLLTATLVTTCLATSALWFPTGSALSQEQIRLSPAEARIAARSALLAGDLKTATVVSRALLKRDPNDITALVVLSGALQAQNQGTAAIKHAKRAYRLTDSDRARFDAAMIIARANYQERRFTAAQFWLRKSGHVAPSPELRSIAMRDYRAVQQVKPLETKLHFGVAPSSNVNNGSESEIVILNGLPFVLSGDAQALSGVEATIGLKATRRFSVGEGRAASLGVNLLSRTYRLSAASLAVSGGKTGADYAFGAAEIELGFSGVKQGANAAPQRNSLTVTLGRNYYAGAPLTDYVRAQIGRETRNTTGASLRFGASIDRQIRLDSFTRSAFVTGLSAAKGIRLANGAMLGLSYNVSDVASASSEIAHVSQFASVNYRLAKPVLGTQLSFSVGVSGKNYKMPYLSPAPRRDIGLSASMSILLPKYEVMGFAPNIDLNLSRNFSSVDLYDTTKQSVSVGVKSTF